MPGWHGYLLFIAAGLLLNITPGADMLYVITSAARQGIRHGLAAAVGVFAGMLVHITLAVAGLSAILAASALAFAVVKYVGAAYLVYLGVMLWLHSAKRGATGGKAPRSAPNPRQPLLDVLRRGALVNVLNPKIALFFLAFLPQFIDPAAGHRAWAFAVLGLTFNATGLFVNGLAAVSAVAIGRVPGVVRAGRWAQRGVGALFIGLGVKLSLEQAG